MMGTADNQIFHINIQNVGNVIQCLEIRLNGITTPFAHRAIGFTHLRGKPFPRFLLFRKYSF